MRPKILKFPQGQGDFLLINTIIKEYRFLLK